MYAFYINKIRKQTFAARVFTFFSTCAEKIPCLIYCKIRLFIANTLDNHNWARKELQVIQKFFLVLKMVK